MGSQEVGGVFMSDFNLISRPYCSFSEHQQRRFFVAIVLLICLVAGGFSLVGAWMVMPFAGLELLALAVAFYYVNYTAEDYESIWVGGDCLVVERRILRKTERIEFSRYWVRVIMAVSHNKQELRLRSHDKEIEFGRYMSEEQRFVLARELKSMTGTSYR